MGEVYCLQENNIESKEQSKFSEFITDKKKIIICDEAWLFLKFKESAEFLVNVARRRKKI